MRKDYVVTCELDMCAECVEKVCITAYGGGEWPLATAPAATGRRRMQYNYKLT